MSRKTSMMKNGMMVMFLAVALGLAAGGCINEGEEKSYSPAADVTGLWNATVAGERLGVMRLVMSGKGIVSGQLTTDQGAVAQLSGAVDGLASEIQVVFPTENYLAVVSFNPESTSAGGNWIDSRGFKSVLQLWR